MPPTPSVLDWLKFKLGQPRVQRWLRFGLAALFAVLGGLALLGVVAPGLGAALVISVSVGWFFGSHSGHESNAPVCK